MQQQTIANKFIDGSFLYTIGGRALRTRGIEACQDKALAIAASLDYRTLANIGDCGQTRWPNAKTTDACYDIDADFNTKPLPFDNEQFDLVVCEQVIEHLHATTFFLAELHRILKRAGHLLLSTENLASIPNIAALLLGQAPFSTQSVCGNFVGGWKRGHINPQCQLPINHPAYAGVRGHVRVMTTKQLRTLLEAQGLCVLDKFGFGLNHYILFHATKR